MPQLARHSVPKQGLDHPAFADLPATDHLIAHFIYTKRLDDEQYAKTENLQADWVGTVDWKKYGGEPEFHAWADSRIDVQLRIGGVANPREPLLALVEHLRGLGVEIHEAFLSRWTVVNPDNGLMGPVAEPGQPQVAEGSFADTDAFMEALLDPDGDPIAPENDLQLKGALVEGDDLALEQRGHLLHVPGVRIGYGVQTAYESIPGDARTDAVEAALADCVSREFSTAWNYNQPAPFIPAFRNFARENGRVDTIVANGRRGYELSFLAGDLQVKIRKGFRQREYEVVHALGAVIRKLELEPAIGWIRIGSPAGPMGPLKTPIKYFFQLWEKAGKPVPAVAPREPATWPPASADCFLEDWIAKVVSHNQLVRGPRKLREQFEANLGAKIPADVMRFLEARETRTLSNRVIGPLELDDSDVVFPDPAKGNLMEQLLFRPYGTLLQGLFMNAVPIGYLRGSGATAFAQTVPDRERAIIFGAGPNTGGQVVADGLSPFLTLCEAINRRAGDSDLEELLSGRISPALDFEPFSAEPFKGDNVANQRYGRAFWLFQLLGLLRIEKLDWAVNSLKEWGNVRVNFQKAKEAGNVHTRATAGLYLLWSMFFVNDPRLAEAIEITGKSTLPVLEAASELLAQVQGGRRNVGPFKDLVGTRDQFLGLARAQAPEAVERALT